VFEVYHVHVHCILPAHPAHHPSRISSRDCRSLVEACPIEHAISTWNAASNRETHRAGSGFPCRRLDENVPGGEAGGGGV